MTSPPVFVYPDTSLWRAARAMQENDCGFLPVVVNGIALGVITERDLALATADASLAPSTKKVSEIMSSPAHGVGIDEEFEVALATMLRHRVHRLVVTDDRGVLRGVLALGDLVAHIDNAKLAEMVRGLNVGTGPISAPVVFSWLTG